MKIKKPTYLITAIGYDGRVANSHPTKNYNQAKTAFEILAKFAEVKRTIAEIHLIDGITNDIILTRTFEEIEINEDDNSI